MENNRAENSHQPSRRRSSRPSRCAGAGQRLIRVRRRLIARALTRPPVSSGGRRLLGSHARRRRRRQGDMPHG